MRPGGSDGALLALAERAARRAGRWLAAGATRRVERETGRDIKLAADRASETILLASLKGSGLQVLSEEAGWGSARALAPVSGAARLPEAFWVVDPLDGSYNFSRGMPACCVAVGLWRGGPALGAVYDFNRRELYSGIAGRGAWLNGRRFRVSAVAQASRAVLCTGFPVRMDYSPRALRAFTRWVRTFKKIRMLGSAALSLAYVAAGRADAYYERGVTLWDVAAAAAVVLGAGGREDLEPTEKLHSLDVYATNGRLRRPSARPS
jgi:myo-inositol-1(or 4)-monophosphatase